MYSNSLGSSRSQPRWVQVQVPNSVLPRLRGLSISPLILISYSLEVAKTVLVSCLGDYFHLVSYKRFYKISRNILRTH